jgi:hypothetical protein
LRFLQELKRLPLLPENALPEQRERYLRQVAAKLRRAAKVIDQFESSVHAAWTLVDDLLFRFRREGVVLKASRTGGEVRSAAAAVAEATSVLDTPSNLLKEAVVLWTLGLRVGTANRLARAGFCTLPELAALRPVSSLLAYAGIGRACVKEVEDLLLRRGYDPHQGAVPPLTFKREPRPAPPKKVMDWASLEGRIAETLQRLGGSASLTELLREPEHQGRSSATLRKGLLDLERTRRIYRTGIKRATRYHLASPEER